MAQHDAFDWLSLSAAYLGVLGLAGGVFRYWVQSRDRQREQPSRVFAWYGSDHAPNNIVVRNLSDKPIFGVIVRAKAADGTRIRWPAGMLDAGTDKFQYGGTAPKGTPILPQTLGITFFDASGRAWYRAPTAKVYRWRWWTRQKYEISLRRDERILAAKRALESRNSTTGT